MAQEKYELFVKHFCKYVGLAEPAKILNGDPIAIDGINCALLYNENAFHDRVFIYYDYGALPVSREKEACIALLQYNHAHYSGNGRSFGCSEDGRNIIVSDHVNLFTASAETLAERIAGEIENIKQWRQHYFLTVAGAEAGKVNEIVSRHYAVPRNLASQIVSQ